jgi:hypothetical protein
MKGDRKLLPAVGLSQPLSVTRHYVLTTVRGGSTHPLYMLT